MQWFPDSFDQFLRCLVILVISFIVMVIAGIGCTFDTGSSCAAYTDAKDNFIEVGQRLLGPFLILVAGFLLISCRRFVIGLVKAIVSIPIFILKSIVAVLLFSLRAIVTLPAWLHYFFVPHPGESAIKAARKYRIPGKIDTEAVASAMKRDIGADLDPFAARQPVYKSENQRKRAEASQKLAEADRKLFEELEARERARRKMEKVKRGEE
jgi:hypothetical protein